MGTHEMSPTATGSWKHEETCTAIAFRTLAVLLVLTLYSEYRRCYCSYQYYLCTTSLMLRFYLCRCCSKDSLTPAPPHSLSHSLKVGILWVHRIKKAENKMPRPAVLRRPMAALYYAPTNPNKFQHLVTRP